MTPENISTALGSALFCVALFFAFAWWNTALAGHIGALFTGRAAGLRSLVETATRVRKAEQERFGLISKGNRYETKIVIPVPAPEPIPTCNVTIHNSSPSVAEKRSSFVPAPAEPIAPVTPRPRRRAPAKPQPRNGPFKWLWSAIKNRV